jgi:hypothetical protein
LLSLGDGGDTATALGTVDFEKWMSAYERQYGFLCSSLDLVAGSGAGSATWNVGLISASQLQDTVSQSSSSSSSLTTQCIWSPFLHVVGADIGSKDNCTDELKVLDTQSDTPSPAAWSTKQSHRNNSSSSSSSHAKETIMESQLSLGNISKLARVVCYRQGRSVVNNDSFTV